MAFMAVVHAGPVDQQTAQRLGSRFLSTTAVAQRNADIQLQLVSAASTRGVVDYYVYNVKKGEGFVIIAGDDRVKPVLAYSTTGSFDPENTAEGFEYMLNSFRSEIQYIREHHLSATPDIVAEWRSVATDGNLKQGCQARSVVGPLCQTIWNQNFPYNSQCPEDEEGAGGHVYAGCVATAMGQIMKYWNYPERGNGTHTYNPDGYEQQTANFGETDYHFELMPLALDSTSTEEDYFYIAQFLHHCGIAVDMQYSGHGSGAYSFSVPPALESYFGYTADEDESFNFWGFYFYNTEQWIQMLKDGGLDENMPLYYSGSDDNGAGGHAFVCDGYDENDYFHFNWGWSGRDDAWCPIGALNTTKYAFNDSNGFIGHIIPAESDYYQRADSVVDFTVSENAARSGVSLSWTNPSMALNGDLLNAIDSISIRRNNQPLVTLTDVQVGGVGSYEDSGLAPGLYEYGIFVYNAAGVSRTAYRSILVGEKCDVVFALHDEGGDGWKGAAISVADENGQRIAIIGMDEGSEQTVTVPLLKQNLSFIWNHGWYHTAEEYDTDFECSFTIYDAEGNEIYVSGQLEDGVFVTHYNDCDATLTCYPVQNLQGEYQWHDAEEYGTYLTWDKPVDTTHLRYFSIYRALLPGYADWLGNIDYDGSDSYEFFDETTNNATGRYLYMVSTTYIDEDQQCESERESFEILVTDISEMESSSIEVYPNPTNGIVTIEGSGRLIVTNILGQEILTREIKGQTTLELSKGIYFIRIGNATQKVVVE